MGHDESYFEIHSVTKIFPTHLKHIEFKKPIRKSLVSQREQWDESYRLGLVFETYDEFLQRRKKNKLALKNEKQNPIYVPWQLSLPFDAQYGRFLDTMSLDMSPSPTLLQLEAERALKRSVRRSVMNVKELGFCNEFDMFITFTFAHDHFDVQKSIKKMTNWLREQQKKQKTKWGLENDRGFEYILVMEYHEKGGVHFHGLFSNYQGRFQESKNPHTGKPVIKGGKIVYNLLSWSHGFSTMTEIRDKNKTVSYVTKYITKTFNQTEFAGKKRYWRSKGLKKAQVVYNRPVDVPEDAVSYDTDLYRLSYLPDPVTTGESRP